MKVGIIAEDESDVAVLREVTLALLRPHRIGFRRFVGNGSGKLRRKCGAWATTLVKQGCPWIVVVHDLDIHDEQRLRTDLTNAIMPARAKVSVVLVPKREIEAWLLYDSSALPTGPARTSWTVLPVPASGVSAVKRSFRDRCPPYGASDREPSRHRLRKGPRPSDRRAGPADSRRIMLGDWLHCP